MSPGCIIKDCQEEAIHKIHHPETKNNAMICETHVILIPGYEPNTEEE
jgi:hypothetical protein|tara:strand:- start:1102 stop:1245 length:144 start_codon:yes stop_codon:yes gene_type:complete